MIQVTRTVNGRRITMSEYRVWNSMKQRCLNPKRHNYHHYGGRGITIHASWLHSFETFYRDVGPRPSLAHTLDRIDGSKGYEPGNCKWATKLAQSRNRRTVLRYNGFATWQLGRKMKVSASTIRNYLARLSRGETSPALERLRALITPMKEAA